MKRLAPGSMDFCLAPKTVLTWPVDIPAYTAVPLNLAFFEKVPVPGHSGARLPSYWRRMARGAGERGDRGGCAACPAACYRT